MPPEAEPATQGAISIGPESGPKVFFFSAVKTVTGPTFYAGKVLRKKDFSINRSFPCQDRWLQNPVQRHTSRFTHSIGKKTKASSALRALPRSICNKMLIDIHQKSSNLGLSSTIASHSRVSILGILLTTCYSIADCTTLCRKYRVPQRVLIRSQAFE